MKQVQLTVKDIRDRFQMKFKGAVGNVYAAPGRINLIGEHTDYNGGYVFPGAVDKGMIAEVRPNGTDSVKAFAIDHMTQGRMAQDYEIFNIGTGRPVSVLELVNKFEQVNHLKLNYKIVGRRAGDRKSYPFR